MPRRFNSLAIDAKPEWAQGADGLDDGY